MKPDLYTTAVLTVIALMLIVIACNQLHQSEGHSAGTGPFAGVQFSGGQGYFQLFDSRKADVWIYGSSSGNQKHLVPVE
jgi:hypothetical protein